MPNKSRPAAAPASPAERAAADALVAHVGRVLAAAGPDPARLAGTDWVVARPDPGTPPPAGGRRVACAGCGWAVDCLPADAARLAAAGCPRCRAGLADRPMPARPARRPADQRRRPRRAPTGSVRAGVCRAGDPRRANLAVAVVDVCPEGLGVWLTEPVAPGEAVRVVVTPEGRGPVSVGAEVRWCAPGGGVTHRAGLRLSRELTRAELAELAL